MILSDISIKRPVFASVISLLLIAFGLISFERLALREYPNIDPPVVTVEVDYPGAPANVVETRITELIEERIAGVEGIEYIESSSSDGRSKVSIEFSINRDVDAAANDIRDRVAGIVDNLPEEADAPEVQKVDGDDDVILWQNLASDRLSVPELTDYASRYLVDRYGTLDGVARVRVGGGMGYAMRIWLDRKALAARGLSAGDVERALRAENIELPAGRLESKTRLFQARVDRNFKHPDDFEQLVLAQGSDGYLVRLGDVARIELGVQEDRTFFRGNGIPMVGIGIIKQSTANTIDVARAAKKLTAKLNPTLPEGMSIEQSYDSSVFIEASIREVYMTLLIAMVCVVVVIYLFLGSWRATLVPAVAVPVSIIATFSVIYALGFSINILTLLALVLAIGLVVDDAIVMLENIVRRTKELGETPLVAAYRGAREVGFAVIATTLVLIAVFVPITFLQGDIGRLFTEFALTISAAVAFSSLIALTLSPVLASLLLKPENDEGAMLQRIDRGVKRVRGLYLGILRFFIGHIWVVAGLFVMLLGVSAWIYPKIAKEFIPKEDRGAFYIMVSGPEGATHEYMNGYMSEIERRMQPYIDSGEIHRVLVRTPRGFGNLSNFNSGIVVCILSDWSQRRSAWKMMEELRKNLADLPGVRAFPVMRQGLGGRTRKPVQFVLGGATYEELAQWRDIIMEEVSRSNPGFLGLDSSYKETRPQLDFIVDYDRAASLGVSIEEIGTTLETLMGGKRITTFIDRGEEYDVIVEGERSFQRSFEDINNIYVRSMRSDTLIPLSNLVQIKEYGSAETLTRYNRIRSITLEANLDESTRLGDALTYLERVVREKLPETAVVDYKGQSRDFMRSGSSILFVFALGIVVVFLVLAAQFESYVHPFVIMLTVPLAMGGGLFGLYLFDASLNIYSQIALIILVGLAAKNGILIVEFANQLRDRGMAFDAALLEACSVRFRPILMTGLTTVAGAVPLILSHGAGSETRTVIGIVILGGVLAATLFTLFVVPVAYSLLARHTSSPQAVAQRLEREAEQTPSEAI
jgi:multidrug efflux pump